LESTAEASIHQSTLECLVLARAGEGKGLVSKGGQTPLLTLSEHAPFDQLANGFGT